ncbi:aldose 1-epimerase family protein [Arthrobacter sp. H14]|uniref:aldose 1-epimerase family protein n=1 Tax=Arthrobacter sp. H14 TaxID=1312959 RepID=UPI0004B76761|nr:aldose 1-epimerase family protein [Arthrobacter sp. H14]
MNGNAGSTKRGQLTGTEYAISAGDYDAVIVAQGAALRQLQHRGRDLVISFDAGAPIPDYRGVIAAPWPNRIADGTYTFDGTQYQAEMNEPERNTALHGLVFDREWQLQDHRDSSVTLTCELEPTAGYPFRLRLEVQYGLDDDGGLHTTVTATNTGDRPAPYGVCPHPYLVVGTSPLEEWVLELPADTFLEVTEDRLLPLETAMVQGHEFDFRTPRTIGSVEIDHAFTDINWDAEGRAALLLRDPAGTGVGMSWDRTCPWLQVHTADKPEPLPNRLGLAVEPMTCPPDAFNSGTDLIRLEPGAAHTAGWSIFAS